MGLFDFFKKDSLTEDQRKAFKKITEDYRQRMRDIKAGELERKKDPAKYQEELLSKEGAFLEKLKNDPEDIEALLNLGLIYFIKKDYGNCTKAYQRSIELNPNLPSNYSMLGTVFYQQGTFDKALSLFEKAIKLGEVGEALIQTHNQIGNIYLKKGNYQGAIEHFKEVLKIDPSVFAANYNLALAYSDNSDTIKEAKEQWQRCLIVAKEMKLEKEIAEIGEFLKFIGSDEKFINEIESNPAMSP